MPTVTTYPGVFGPYSPITFTRASTGTYFDSTGTLTTAAIDAPRLDYDPATLAAQGFLVEEARTNGIRNNTMQGAVAGTPGTLPQVSGGASWSSSSAGGVSREVVGVGSINGINYIDIRVFGTTTNTNLALNLYFELATQIAALTGQTWSESVWVQMVGGSTTGISQIYLAMVEISSGGVDLAYLTGPDFKSTIGTFTRRPYTATTSNASTAFIRPGLWVSHTGIGAVIDITLRIGLPQLEQGAFATSVIPTTTMALTRSEDRASVNTLSPWYNQTEGTVYAELQSLSPLTGAQSVALNKYPHVWQIEAGASDSTLWCYGLNSELYIATTYNNIGTVPSGINKIAAALAPTAGQSRSSLNGAAAVNRNGTLAGTATGFFLGRDSTAGVNNFLNGYLRRLTYYPRALSAAELQAITA